MTVDHVIVSQYFGEFKKQPQAEPAVVLSASEYNMLVHKAKWYDEIHEMNELKVAPHEFIKQTALEVACTWYGQNQEKVLSKSRKYRLVLCRDAIVYCLIKVELTTTDIGNMFNQDHSTVIHNRYKVEDRMTVDKDYKTEITNIFNIFKSKINALKKDNLTNKI